MINLIQNHIYDISNKITFLDFKVSMKILDSNSTTAKAAIFCILLSVSGLVKADDPPFTVRSDLFNQSETDSLGLKTAEGTETVTIFEPGETTDQFSNGAVMIGFKDQIYCMWQSSETDEDAQDTWVAYSRSEDGLSWTEPMVLAESIAEGYCSSGGWWATEDTLVAYINTWPASISPRGGYTRYITSFDGLAWSEIRPLLMSDGDTLQGIFEQDPHALPDGRIINAAHFQPGINVAPIYTDDPLGTGGWTRADFTNLSTGDVSREIEPSWYLRGDDAVVMVFRDQDGTYKKLASVSHNRGETWSSPVLTDMPDSRSKQSAGNIGDSTAFFASNPVDNKLRIPLVLTLSKDGSMFNTAYVLRRGGSGIQDLRYEGKAKRSGYHYPKSMIWNDYLYVSYTTNKEDVEYTRVPLSSMVLNDSVSLVGAIPTQPEIEKIKIFMGGGKTLRISQQDLLIKGTVSFYSLQGQLLFNNNMNSTDISINMDQHPAGYYIVEVRTKSEREVKLINIW